MCCITSEEGININFYEYFLVTNKFSEEIPTIKFNKIECWKEVFVKFEIWITNHFSNPSFVIRIMAKLWITVTLAPTLGKKNVESSASLGLGTAWILLKLNWVLNPTIFYLRFKSVFDIFMFSLRHPVGQKCYEPNKKISFNKKM